MKPSVPVVLVALLLAAGCGGDGSDRGNADGTGGTPLGEGGNSGGGTGGKGAGGSGQGGGAGDPLPPCLPGAEEGACEGCIATALFSCASVDPSCGEAFASFFFCAETAGCLTDTGPDLLCVLQACPDESEAVGTCVMSCPALKACAGF